MAKFNTTDAKNANPATHVMETTGQETVTHEGAKAYVQTPKTELFSTAVANFVSEKTFYESAQQRDDRFAQLIREVTTEDPEWMKQFVPWLRGPQANMRSAPLAVAAWYVKAGGPNGKDVIDGAMARADEPTEFLALWASMFGKNFPQPVKKGVRQAMNRLFNEYSALKYDSQGATWRMADAIDLTHPDPKDEHQSALYGWLLDRRHRPEEEWNLTRLEKLPMITANAAMRSWPQGGRRPFLETPDAPQTLKDAGFTWESLSAWLNSPMDKLAWETMIPNMGYMAKLRNLRNFDGAGVSDFSAATVMAKLADPMEVRTSRQFPFRFLSAYREVGNDRWKPALTTAFEHSFRNVPELDGETLVLIDTSSSMTAPLTAKTKIRRAEAAAVLGIGFARKQAGVQMVSFASGSEEFKFIPGETALHGVDRFMGRIGVVGHGTEITAAVVRWFDPKRHARVVIVTDMQAFADFRGTPGEVVPKHVPMYAFDVGGYGRSMMKVGKENRFQLAGLTDAAFRLIPLLEAGRQGRWPWEQQ